MAKSSIGQFIAALRKANGMTQQEVADCLNVSNKSVSRWERDECAPDISLIPVLAELFGVTCDELLKGERIANDTPKEKSRPKIEKQFKALLNRAVSRFKTMMWISLALSAVGFVCMLGISYGFYRPQIGFAVMMLFEIVAFVLAVININKMKEIQMSNELFETVDDSVKEYYYKSLGNFSYYAIYAVVAVIALSLPLIIFNTNFVYSVMFFEDYFICVIVIALFLSFLFVRTKERFEIRVSGREKVVVPVKKGSPVRKMNVLQIGASVLAVLIFIFAPYLLVTPEEVATYDTLLVTMGIIGLMLLLLNIICFFVFFIRKKDYRKQMIIPGIRNMLLCVPAFVISTSHYVGVNNSNEVFHFYGDELGWGIGIAIMLFVVFGILDFVVTQRKKENK